MQIKLLEAEAQDCVGCFGGITTAPETWVQLVADISLARFGLAVAQTSKTDTNVPDQLHTLWEGDGYLEIYSRL